MAALTRPAAKKIRSVLWAALAIAAVFGAIGADLENYRLVWFGNIGVALTLSAHALVCVLRGDHIGVALAAAAPATVFAYLSVNTLTSVPFWEVISAVLDA